MRNQVIQKVPSFLPSFLDLTNKPPPTAVSKTTKELLLEWDMDNAERPAVSVAKELRMPQFSMKRITTNRCNSQYHMGESNRAP